MEQQGQRIRLKLPEQDLQVLTIGSDQPKKLQAWVDQLPTINMGETSRQLYQYIQELNRLSIDSRTRFQLLEIVRKPIGMVCEGLAKHYLNQSLVLPEKARRVASLAQSLQAHLANGYKLVVVRGMRKLGEKGDARSMVTTAVHRAISAFNEILLRCYQLYFPTPRNLWLEMHQLYLLAEYNKLQYDEVTDPAFRLIETSSIADAYGRALLLAAAKPNQLRQQELALIHNALEEWSGLIEIKPAAGNEDLFVFDLNTDRAPTYRTHVSVAREGCRYIESSQLVSRIIATAEGRPPADFTVPKAISDSLLAHLQRAWGALTERSFQRVDQAVSLGVCFGLGALHYFSAGERDFSSLLGRGKPQLLVGDDDNPFINRRTGGGRPGVPDDEDPWGQALDGGGHKMGHDAAVESIDLSRITSALHEHASSSGEGKSQAYKQHRCETVNVSPGGYCLSWQGETPAQLRTGELVGILEERNQEWAVGVVRWVKQLTSQGAQFGVELLAPRALPAGGRILKKTGDASEFMRLLVLPELHAIGQPATLLTPSVGFQTGIKVELIHEGRLDKIQLQRKVNSTAGFGQFEYRSTEARSEPDALTPGGGEDDDFNSIWTSL